jgi:hypothetical protein
MESMMDRFRRLGFASTLCRFKPPPDLNTLDSQGIMDRYETGTSTHLQFLFSPLLILANKSRHEDGSTSKCNALSTSHLC